MIEQKKNGDQIKDEKHIEGYIVNEEGRIIGEARKYDPYSRKGEMMMYDIDSFGFLWGYFDKKWTVMSENDLGEDSKLRKELKVVKYESWKRHNTTELQREYHDRMQKSDSYDRFCKQLYDEVLLKDADKGIARLIRKYPFLRDYLLD